MHPLDPFRYLLGNAGAIRRIASDWRAILVGFLFVLTAGIARNYDHLNLLTDKEWYLGPIIMSLVSTVWIGIVVFGVLHLWKKGAILRNWLIFLTLFWMTAPVAWLYAIPFESFMSIGQATVANFICLLLVSSWRVALIIRSLTILTGAAWQRCFLAVIAPAAIEMWVGLWFKQLSLVSIMGGIRELEPHEEFIKNATTSMQWVCFIGFFIALAIGSQARNVPQEFHSLLPNSKQHANPSFATFLPPIIALTFFLATSVLPQKLVKNGEEFHSLYDKSNWSELYTFLQRHPRSDFPHSFESPTPYNAQEIIKLINLHRNQVPTWVADHWESQLIERIKTGRGQFDSKAFVDNPLYQEMTTKYPDIFRHDPIPTTLEK